MILVTGVTGNAGRPLIDLDVGALADVRAVTRDPRSAGQTKRRFLSNNRDEERQPLTSALAVIVSHNTITPACKPAL